MIIRNCLKLLNELSHIEKDISFFEQELEGLNIDYDREKILKRLIQETIKDAD